MRTSLPTPVPPFHGLSLHVAPLGTPSRQSIPRSRSLVLQVLAEEDARLFGGDCAGFGVFVQQVAVVGVAGLVVCEDGAVVGELVLQIEFFGLNVSRSMSRRRDLLREPSRDSLSCVSRVVSCRGET